MIIEKLIEFKSAIFKENEKKFPNDLASFEMFKKKYDGSYYSYYTPYCPYPFINKLHLPIEISHELNLFDIRKLPRKDDKIYLEIKNFPDYDYLNSIAYEMVIRTSEYKKIQDDFEFNNREEKIKECEQLGIDINYEFSLKKVLEKQYKSNNKTNFTNSSFNMTLSDIDQGLDRLINFYINKKEIYIIDNEKIIQGIILNRTFKIISDITYEDVKSNIKKFYIPAKYDYQTPDNKNMSVIDINIPLIALELDFLISIENLIPNRIKGVIDFNFTRPLLRFKELPIVDVPINLNLSKKELIQLINKLKDDFEDGTIKNPINALYDTKYEFKKLEDIVPFKMTKETISEAFFVYDLYQCLDIAINSHKNKLLNFKNIDFGELKENTKNKLKEKKSEIDEIINNHKKHKNTKLIEVNKRELRIIRRKLKKEEIEEIIDINKKYKEYSKEYNTMSILHELVENYNISPYMCKQYLKFMRKYIDNLKYKELIIGIKSKSMSQGMSQ